MPLTYAATAITITGPDGIPTTEGARILSLSLSHGENWGVAKLLYPGLNAFAKSVKGKTVDIAVGGAVVFRGIVVSDDDVVGGKYDNLIVTVADLRWDMARRKVGQFGVGDLNEFWGGFASVGYRVHFNPGGRGNRSAAADDGVYEFAAGPTAEKWTRRQILTFLLHWYYPDMQIPASGPYTLPAAWDEVENDLYAYLKPLPAVLTDLAARAGGSWALRYDDDDTYFQPLHAAPSETTTLDLPEAAGSAQASNSTAYSVIDLQVSRSILDSADIVEIHSAPTIVECVHSNYGINGLLTSYLDERAPLGYARIFRVDVTKYGTWKLGDSYPAGSLPKRWARQLATRMDETGTGYITASTIALLKAGRGTPLRPEDCAWIAFDNPETDRHRLLSGITILHDYGIILVHNHVEFDGGSYDFNEGAEPTLWIWVTLGTIIERNYLYRSATPTSWHISAEKPIVHVVQRTDFQPLERIQSMVPKLGSTDPSEYEILVPAPPATAAELYIDIEPEMKMVHDAVKALRGKAEVTLRAILQDMPPVVLGNKLAIAPADARLTGSEIVVGLDYDDERAELILSATNNLARAVANDL